MDAPPQPEEKPRFRPNIELCAPGLRAPLPLVPNSRALLCEVFRAALERRGTPPALIEPAAATGGGLVHALQEFVAASNRLITEKEKPALAEAVRRALWASRDLLGARNAAYVLVQAAEEPEPGRLEREAESERLKGLMEPLERRFEELGLPVNMDPVHFAAIEVRLDDIYDHAGRQLQRFYRAVERPEAGGGFAAFTRELAKTVAREIIPDHLTEDRAGERPTLLNLLAELEREFV
jgi:hypothetical protein